MTDKSANFGTKDQMWFSREMANTNQPSTLESDVFVLGCFYHFVLSGGHHPFGVGEKVKFNTFNGQYEAYQENWQPNINELPDKKQLAVDLMKQMIRWQVDHRLSIEQVLNHGFFQTNESYNLYGDEK